MLYVIDNLLPANALQDLRDLCDIHGRLKEQHDGDTQFSWRPEPVLPARFTQPLSKPSLIATSTRPCSSGNTVRIPAGRSRVVVQCQ